MHLAGAGVLTVAIMVAAMWSGHAFQSSLHAASEAPPQPAEIAPVSDTDHGLRVLVFFDPSHVTCAECSLHTWRFAYYTEAFREAGAEVFGIAGGLRDGLPQIDPELPLPWEMVYDLSGRLADLYGVYESDNLNPTVVIVEGDGRVLYRGQPRGYDDRVEGDVLTTLQAVKLGMPLDRGERAVAHVR